MKFDWTVRTIGEWRQWLKKSTDASWMQNWPYAQAIHKYDKLRTRMALLIGDHEKPIGMVAIQELKLGPIQIINIKRGPIWFSGSEKNEEIEFSKELRKEFPKSLLQRLRWIPSRELSDQSISEIVRQGYQIRKEHFFTNRIYLKEGLVAIRKQLKQKWRNGLNKAEKADLTIVIDSVGDQLGDFVSGYAAYKMQKRFHGPSPRFLATELKQAFLQTDGLIIICKKDNKVVAGGAFTISGKCMSYRAGWCDEIGRKENAGYLVLWNSVKEGNLRELEILDIGGLLPEEAPGVTKFKKGMSGEDVRLVTLC